MITILTINIYFYFHFIFLSGVAVDQYGYIYITDTLNNAIRLIKPDGTVITIAGLGPESRGARDGVCESATFTEPLGLAVKHEWVGGVDVTVVLVADTGNHRIR